MEQRDYVIVDVETTGTDPKKHQILAMALLALDSNLKPTGSASIRIKHDEYVVDPKALEVNKINLVKAPQQPKISQCGDCQITYHCILQYSGA